MLHLMTWFDFCLNTWAICHPSKSIENIETKMMCSLKLVVIIIVIIFYRV